MKRTDERFGSRHAMSILLLASVLLLVREIFSIATVNNPTKQNAEHFWYPFIALPENSGDTLLHRARPSAPT